MDIIYTQISSKEVWKSNFRQYGQMEKQRWKESERRREEVRRSDKRREESEERRCRCTKRSKSRLAKAAGAEPAGQVRDEELHAVVARSTFPSQKCQKLTGSEHFWKFWCGKSVGRCGTKHISKSKCTKHTTFSALLEVLMWKKCRPLWHEAHFQVKMYKTHHFQRTFGS